MSELWGVSLVYGLHAIITGLIVVWATMGGEEKE
jgi:hypothetical protein